MYSSSRDAARGVGIGPPNRSGGFVVVTNVLEDLTLQIGDGREDTAREDVALDLREPQLDLIQPRRIRRRKVQVHARMLRQERADLLGLMRRQIVENDVNLGRRGLRRHNLGQKCQEVRAGVSGRLAEDFAGLRIERRIQRQRAVPLVFEAVTLRPSRREREPRIDAIERLNRGLLVEAEDHGVLRRGEIQTDHIGCLRLEIRIGGAHVTLEAMRLEPGPLPGPLHERVAAQAERGRERPGAPLRRPVRRRLSRPRQDPRFESRRQHGRCVFAIPALESGDARFEEALLPLGDRAGTLAQRDQLAVGGARGQPQDDARPAREVGATAARARQRLQRGAFVGGQGDLVDRVWHAPHYHLHLSSTSH